MELAWAGPDVFSAGSAVPIRSDSAAKPFSVTIPTDISRLQVPLEHTTLKEFHQGTNGKLIIHIQDAHSNLSGQKSLAGALDEMMTRYGVELVLVEGSSTDVTLDPLKKIGTRDQWKRAANRLLYEGLISGEEFLNLTTDHPMKLIGIESQELYDESLETYAELVKSRQKTLNYLRRIRLALDRVKNKLYPSELLAFESAWSADQDDFNLRVGKLLELADRAGVTLGTDFAEIAKLKGLRAREKQIDFDAANRDQERLMTLAFQGKDEAARKALADAGRRARTQPVAMGAFLRALWSEAEGRGAVRESFPVILAYAEYLDAFGMLKMEDLLGQLDLLEDTVYKTLLADSEDARMTRACDRFLGLLQKAYQIKMSSTEFAMLQLNEKDFSTKLILGFLNRKLLDLGFTEDLTPYQTPIEDARASLEKFYELVDRRDLAFMEKSAQAFTGQQADAAFFIAGGYHTGHLTRLWRGAGYSYAVLTPAVTYETDQDQYENLLLAPLKLARKRIQKPSHESEELIQIAKDLAPEKAADGLRKMDALATAESNGARFAKSLTVSFSPIQAAAVTAQAARLASQSKFEASVDPEGDGGWKNLGKTVGYMRDVLNSGQSDLDYASILSGDQNVTRDAAEVELRTYIHNQASLQDQALIELIANGQDASAAGPTIGRFGLGMYQMFQELKTPDDRIVVTTSDGTSATRMEFRLTNGAIEYKASNLGGGLPKGTRVDVRRNLAPEEIKSKIGIIEKKLATNSRGAVRLRNKDRDAEVTVNQIDGYRYLNGDAVSADIIPPVDVEIGSEGYSIIDRGRGMSPKTIMTKYLMPKGTTKNITGQESESSEEVRSETKIFYRMEGDRENDEAVIRIQVSGVLIQEFKARGLNLPAVTVLELPHAVWLPESRDRVALDQTTIRGLMDLVDKLLAPEREGLDARFALINAIGALAKKMSDETNGKDTRLIHELKQRVSAAVKREEQNGAVFVPNRMEFSAVRTKSGRIVYLDEKLFYFSPQGMKGAELINKFESRSNNRLYLVDLDSSEGAPAYLAGRAGIGSGWILMNRELYDKHKDDPAFIDALLNLKIDYGNPGVQLGRLIVQSDVSAARQEEANWAASSQFELPRGFWGWWKACLSLPLGLIDSLTAIAAVVQGMLTGKRRDSAASNDDDVLASIINQPKALIGKWSEAPYQKTHTRYLVQHAGNMISTGTMTHENEHEYMAMSDRLMSAADRLRTAIPGIDIGASAAEWLDQSYWLMDASIDGTDSAEILRTHKDHLYFLRGDDVYRMDSSGFVERVIEGPQTFAGDHDGYLYFNKKDGVYRTGSSGDAELVMEGAEVFIRGGMAVAVKNPTTSQEQPVLYTLRKGKAVQLDEHVEKIWPGGDASGSMAYATRHNGVTTLKVIDGNGAVTSRVLTPSAWEAIQKSNYIYEFDFTAALQTSLGYRPKKYLKRGDHTVLVENGRIIFYQHGSKRAYKPQVFEVLGDGSVVEYPVDQEEQISRVMTGPDGALYVVVHNVWQGMLEGFFRRDLSGLGGMRREVIGEESSKIYKHKMGEVTLVSEGNITELQRSNGGIYYKSSGEWKRVDENGKEIDLLNSSISERIRREYGSAVDVKQVGVIGGNLILFRRSASVQELSAVRPGQRVRPVAGDLWWIYDMGAGEAAPMNQLLTDVIQVEGGIVAVRKSAQDPMNEPLSSSLVYIRQGSDGMLQEEVLIDGAEDIRMELDGNELHVVNQPKNQYASYEKYSLKDNQARVVETHKIRGRLAPDSYLTYDKQNEKLEVRSEEYSLTNHLIDVHSGSVVDITLGRDINNSASRTVFIGGASVHLSAKADRPIAVEITLPFMLRRSETFSNSAERLIGAYSSFSRFIDEASKEEYGNLLHSLWLAEGGSPVNMFLSMEQQALCAPFMTEEVVSVLEGYLSEAASMKSAREIFSELILPVLNLYQASARRPEEIREGLLKLLRNLRRMQTLNPEFAAYAAGRLLEPRYDLPPENGADSKKVSVMEMYLNRYDQVHVSPADELYLKFMLGSDVPPSVRLEPSVRKGGAAAGASLNDRDLAGLIWFAFKYPQEVSADWPAFLERMSAIDDGPLQEIRNQIAGAVNGQDMVNMVWIREIAQNARDAIRKEKETGIQSGFLGHGFYTLFAGGTNGRTFVRVVTGRGEEGGVELLLQPHYDPKGLLEDIRVVSMTPLAGDFKGTRIERIHRMDGSADEAAVLGQMLADYQVRRYLGAVPGGDERVGIYLNGEAVNQDRPESAEPDSRILIKNGVRPSADAEGVSEWVVSIEDPVGMSLKTVLSKLLPVDVSGKPMQSEPARRQTIDGIQTHYSRDLIPRVTLDGLYVDQPDASYAGLVPESVLGVLQPRGWNVDFPAGTPTTRTRIGIREPQSYRPFVAAHALKDMVLLYLAEPDVELPLLPKDYVYSQTNAITTRKDIERDAQIINAYLEGLLKDEQRLADVDFNRYKQSPHELIQLLTLIRVPSADGRRISMREIKEEVLSRFNGQGSQTPISLPKGMEHLEETIEQNIRASKSAQSIDYSSIADEPILLAFRRFVEELNSIGGVGDNTVGYHFEINGISLAHAAGSEVRFNLDYHKKFLEPLLDFLRRGQDITAQEDMVMTIIHETAHTLERGYRPLYGNDWTHHAEQDVPGTFAWIMKTYLTKLLKNMESPDAVRRSILQEVGVDLAGLEASYQRVADFVKQQQTAGSADQGPDTAPSAARLASDAESKPRIGAGLPSDAAKRIWEDYFRDRSRAETNGPFQGGYPENVLLFVEDGVAGIESDGLAVREIGSGDGTVARHLSKSIGAKIGLYILSNPHEMSSEDRLLGLISEDDKFSYEKIDIERTVPAHVPADVAVATYVLEYTDLNRSLPNVKAMLKPGGRFVGVFHHPESTVAAHFFKRRRMLQRSGWMDRAWSRSAGLVPLLRGSRVDAWVRDRIGYDADADQMYSLLLSNVVEFGSKERLVRLLRKWGFQTEENDVQTIIDETSGLPIGYGVIAANPAKPTTASSTGSAARLAAREGTDPMSGADLGRQFVIPAATEAAKQRMDRLRSKLDKQFLSRSAVWSPLAGEKIVSDAYEELAITLGIARNDDPGSLKSGRYYADLIMMMELQRDVLKALVKMAAAGKLGINRKEYEGLIRRGVFSAGRVLPEERIKYYATANGFDWMLDAAVTDEERKKLAKRLLGTTLAYIDLNDESEVNMIGDLVSALSGVSEMKDSRQRAERVKQIMDGVEHARKTVAEVSQWDLLHRFEKNNPGALRLVRGFRDAANEPYVDSEVGKPASIGKTTFFTHVPGHADDFWEDNARGGVVVADVPVDSIQFTSWVMPDAETDGYEPQIGVQGRATIQRVFRLGGNLNGSDAREWLVYGAAMWETLSSYGQLLPDGDLLAKGDDRRDIRRPEQGSRLADSISDRHGSNQVILQRARERLEALMALPDVDRISIDEKEANQFIPKEIKALFDAADPQDAELPYVVATGGTARDFAVAMVAHSEKRQKPFSMPDSTDVDILIPSGKELAEHDWDENAFEVLKARLLEAAQIDPDLKKLTGQTLDPIPSRWLEGRFTFEYQMLAVGKGKAFSISRLGLTRMNGKYILFGHRSAIKDLQSKKLNLWQAPGLKLGEGMIAKMLGKAAIYNEHAGFAMTEDLKSKINEEIMSMSPDQKQELLFYIRKHALLVRSGDDPGPRIHAVLRELGVDLSGARLAGSQNDPESILDDLNAELPVVDQKNPSDHPAVRAWLEAGESDGFFVLHKNAPLDPYATRPMVPVPWVVAGYLMDKGWLQFHVRNKEGEAIASGDVIATLSPDSDIEFGDIAQKLRSGYLESGLQEGFSGTIRDEVNYPAKNLIEVIIGSEKASGILLLSSVYAPYLDLQTRQRLITGELDRRFDEMIRRMEMTLEPNELDLRELVREAFQPAYRLQRLDVMFRLIEAVRPKLESKSLFLTSLYERTIRAAGRRGSLEGIDPEILKKLDAAHLALGSDPDSGADADDLDIYEQMRGKVESAARLATADRPAAGAVELKALLDLVDLIGRYALLDGEVPVEEIADSVRRDSLWAVMASTFGDPAKRIVAKDDRIYVGVGGYLTVVSDGALWTPGGKELMRLDQTSSDTTMADDATASGLITDPAQLRRMMPTVSTGASDAAWEIGYQRALSRLMNYLAALQARRGGQVLPVAVTYRDVQLEGLDPQALAKLAETIQGFQQRMQVYPIFDPQEASKLGIDLTPGTRAGLLKASAASVDLYAKDKGIFERGTPRLLFENGESGSLFEFALTTLLLTAVARTAAASKDQSGAIDRSDLMRLIDEVGQAIVELSAQRVDIEGMRVISGENEDPAVLERYKARAIALDRVLRALNMALDAVKSAA